MSIQEPESRFTNLFVDRVASYVDAEATFVRSSDLGGNSAFRGRFKRTGVARVLRRVINPVVQASEAELFG